MTTLHDLYCFNTIKFTILLWNPFKEKLSDKLLQIYNLNNMFPLFRARTPETLNIATKFQISIRISKTLEITLFCFKPKNCNN